MLVFIVRRLLVSFFIVLASTALMFALVALSGNPLKDLLAYNGPGREERIAARTAALHLDVGIGERYLLWLQDVGRCVGRVVGQTSAGCTLGLDRQNRPVLPQLDAALGSTLRLVVAATALSVLLGVATGVVAALRQYSTFDIAVTLVAFGCFSLPVFWVSTLLKQYVAIDLNTWLRDPELSYAAIATIGVVAGVVWVAVVGGDLRRRLVVAAVATTVTSGTLVALLASGWFTQPALGAVGVLASALVAAFGWSALLAGLQPALRPVLYAAGTTAAAGTGVGVLAVTLLADFTWPAFGLLAIAVVGLGVGLGYALGGVRRRLAAQVSALTGASVVVLVAIDQLLRAYPAIYAATGGRPVATTGSQTPNLAGSFWETNLDVALHLVLPTLAIVAISFATYTRYTRSSMLGVLSHDYVRTARAKGLSERRVVVRHSLRNALLPLTTLMAFDFAGILGGAVVTETVFGWNGMGRLFTQGLAHTDPNPVMAFFLVTAVATVAFNLLADVAYVSLDPRIRP